MKNENKILLYLRKNTDYCDHHYGLVSGHVEDGESALSAIIREAQEEAGIQIERSSLKVVHMMHRKTDRLNVDLFFACDHWNGNIVNKETEKCAALEFFPLEELPSNTIGYISEALKAIQQRHYYSESGWETWLLKKNFILFDMGKLIIMFLLH